MVAPEFVFYQSVQFSVRKCSGAALTELNIWWKIQLSVFPECFHIFCTLIYIGSAFQKNWLISVCSEHITTEQSGRTCSDNDRPVCQFLCPFYFEMVAVRLNLELYLIIFDRFLNFCFISYLDIYRIDIVKNRLFSGIDRLFADLKTLKFLFFYAKWF